MPSTKCENYAIYLIFRPISGLGSSNLLLAVLPPLLRFCEAKRWGNGGKIGYLPPGRAGCRISNKGKNASFCENDKLYIYG